MSDSAIQVCELEFGYVPNKPVLAIDELHVGKGEKVFIHGPSGSGKTTLLGMLAGILKPDRGEIKILGKDFSNLSGRAKDRFRGDHIGYVFQMFNLIPYLNVEENIVLPCHINARRRTRLGGRSLLETAREIALHLQIADFLQSPVVDLSVGQQQRVAVARALIGSPEILIADEPTSALDSDRREAFLKLLFAEADRQNTTILFVSHDHTLKPLFSKVVELNQINKIAA